LKSIPSLRVFQGLAVAELLGDDVDELSDGGFADFELWHRHSVLLT
jgi:hypothetical protein